MPGFDDGLNVSYKRKRRVKTDSKGCTLNDCKGRFVIYKEILGNTVGRSVLFWLWQLKCYLGM